MGNRRVNGVVGVYSLAAAALIGYASAVLVSTASLFLGPSADEALVRMTALALLPFLLGYAGTHLLIAYTVLRDPADGARRLLVAAAFAVLAAGVMAYLRVAGYPVPLSLLIAAVCASAVLIGSVMRRRRVRRDLTTGNRATDARCCVRRADRPGEEWDTSRVEGHPRRR